MAVAPFTASLSLTCAQTHLASSEAMRCQGLDWPRAKAGLKIGLRFTPELLCVSGEDDN